MKTAKPNLANNHTKKQIKKKEMWTNLTQGNHEWRVEKTQVCPVCVINYSPSINRRM